MVDPMRKWLSPSSSTDQDNANVLNFDWICSVAAELWHKVPAVRTDGSSSGIILLFPSERAGTKPQNRNIILAASHPNIIHNYQNVGAIKLASLFVMHTYTIKIDLYLNIRIIAATTMEIHTFPVTDIVNTWHRHGPYEVEKHCKLTLYIYHDA